MEETSSVVSTPTVERRAVMELTKQYSLFSSRSKFIVLPQSTCVHSRTTMIGVGYLISPLKEVPRVTSREDFQPSSDGVCRLYHGC